MLEHCSYFKLDSLNLNLSVNVLNVSCNIYNSKNKLLEHLKIIKKTTVLFW